ncbi:MAG: hypothetical protein ACSHX0_03955 [Akkermansiaceae bacterium]
MLITLPNIWIIVINVIGIPLTHLLIAWWSTCLPDRLFATRVPFLSPQFGQPISPVYEKVFFIRLWKDSLPDAGPWFKGFSKGKITASDTPYLTRFAAENRRGEFSHWLQLIAISLFIIWNPYPANLVIIAWAVISNLPCILSQRFSRHRIHQILHKREIATHLMNH